MGLNMDSKKTVGKFGTMKLYKKKLQIIFKNKLFK